MIDLFFYSPNIIFAMLSALICLFAVMGAYLCVNMLNYRLREKEIIFGEMLLLIHFALIILALVTVTVNRRTGVITLSNIDTLIYISGIICSIYFVFLAFRKKQYCILTSLAVILTLPIFAKIIYNGYILFLLISTVILYYRIVSLFKRVLHRQRNELNAFSVVDGLNTLPCGVLFCDKSGYVFLINAKMMELAMRYFNEEPKNGISFWKNLKKCSIPNVEAQIVEGDVLLRTSNNAWRFRRQEFVLSGVKYIEITAIDVTESIGVFYALEEENKKLERQRDEIEKLSISIEELRREQEYSRIRSRVHDVLGQRLTAIQKIMQSGEEPDYNMLLSLSQDAIMQIKERKGGNAKELFAEIYRYFDRIGVEIALLGRLPKEENIAFLFLSVLGEASTNAIKHAEATKVYAKIEEQSDRYIIEITNNGFRPQKSLVEGGGLFGIRNRIENAGGTLRVEVIPQFSLIITIRKEDVDDKGIYS